MQSARDLVELGLVFGRDRIAQHRHSRRGAPEWIGIGELAPVIGTPSTVTAAPFAPSTSVAVAVKETARGVS